MSSTAMFIELLVVGFEALIWIALLIGTLFGVDWVPSLQDIFAHAEILVTAILIGLAYLLGIIIDAITDAILEKWEVRIVRSVQGEKKVSKLDMLTHAISTIESARAVLRYPRSRIRILRSSMFNLGLISVGALCLLWTRFSVQSSLRTGLTLFIVTAGLILTGASVYAYWHLEGFYWELVNSFYLTATESQASKPHVDHDAQ